MSKGKNRGTLRYLSEVGGKTKRNILLLALVQMLQGISSVCYALFLRDIVNAAVAGDHRGFYTAIIGFVTLICFQLLLRAIIRFLDEHTRSTLENRFKKRVLSFLLHRDYGAVTAVHSGEWMNRLTSDTMVVADGLTTIFPSVTGMLVRLIGAIVMIVALEPLFLYIIVPGGILLIVLSYSFRNVMKRLHKQIRERDGKLRSFLQDTLGSMLVVRSFGVEDDTSKEAEEKMSAHKQARMQRNRFSNFCNIGFGFVMNGIYVMGAIFCGYGILMGTMSYGTFMAVLQLIGQVQYPFSNISSFLPKYYAMLASAERLMEVEMLPERYGAKPSPLSEVQEMYEDVFRGVGIDDITFTYHPPVQGIEIQMPVTLRNVSLDILKGEYVALVGPSGCGKSTLLKLLMCLYPLDSGERYLLLDEVGKTVVVRHPLTARWQKLFAYVPQGNHLMSGTIREIIAFSDKEQMNDTPRIWQALKVACADDFVSDLEKGVDTLLGERGLGLSEGQMQRLAIARAIFSGYPILLLDECTSALDEVTEKRLLHRLHEMTDKTVVIVTHRLAALEICDKVVRFTDDGSIIATAQEGKA